MRILVISRCPPYPLHLGDRLIVWHLARQLAQRGHQLDLIAFTQYESDQHEIEHYAEFFNRVTLIPETPRPPLGYLTRILFKHRRFPKREKASWSPAMWQSIVEHLAENTYDVIHLFGSVHVYEFYELLKDYPTVITPYESFSLYLKRQIAQTGSISARIQRQIARRMESFMFTPYGRTVVVAEPDQAELQQINPRLQVDVISNGIDLDYFHGERKDRDRYTILFVGNYEYPPNQEAVQFLVHEMLPRVHKQFPQIRLKLVGNGPTEAMEALPDDAIDVTGRVPDIRVYLERATIFVCPLSIGAGIKNKVLEALAMGVPVVATPISVDGIDVKDGQTALISNRADFADTVCELLADRSMQLLLSKRGRQLIEKQYHWGRIAEDYETLYATVIRQTIKHE